MKHRFYNICPDCGASLDPGERCDCHAPDKETAPKEMRVPRMQLLHNSITSIAQHGEKIQC